LEGRNGERQFEKRWKKGEGDCEKIERKEKEGAKENDGRGKRETRKNMKYERKRQWKRKEQNKSREVFFQRLVDLLVKESRIFYPHNVRIKS